MARVGRPKKPRNERKTERFELVMTREDRRRIQELADAAGLSIGAYITAAALKMKIRAETR